MKFFNPYVWALCAVFALFVNMPAKAAELIVFGENQLSDVTIAQISKYESIDKDRIQADFVVARIDLNADLSDEYILKSKSCAPSSGACFYKIFVSQPNAVLKVYEGMAKNLEISERAHYGVHDLLVYENKLNDYKYSVYVWNFDEARYTLEVDEGKS